MNETANGTDSNTDLPLLTRREDDILIVILNRPHALNAVDRPLAEAIEAVMDSYAADRKLRVAVITGAGGTFCSGADLKSVARGESRSTPGRGSFGVMRRPPLKPLIAAVEGYALGGGFELALSCDLIVAARNSQFGLPEVKRCRVAVGGGLFRLPKRLPYHLAMQLALTGVTRSAESMQGFGLFAALSEQGSALADALALARVIASNAPLAVQATKQIIQESVSWDSDDAWDLQMTIAEEATNSSDAIEGLQAFIEKRQPTWTGQ